jgi:hypothetical protein
MIVELLNDPMTLWLFVTAVVFTLVGRYLFFRDHIHTVTAAVIDSLIKDGYLKTRGVGRNQEILKHTEWCKKDVDIL